MPPAILPPGSSLASALPSPADGFSLLSYNILLPNSLRGWWITKYYEPSVAPEHRAWPHRQALLRQGLAAAQADVLCLQEIIPESADADLGFLREMGYDHVLHKKGDLRCATFWRRDRLQLSAEPQHKDRTLLTAFRSLAEPYRCVHVINVHLKAGADPARRLRQVSEALDQAAKTARTLKQDTAQTAVVIAGDFNSEPRGSAVQRLLQRGEVDPSTREAAFPAVELTSRPRTNPFGPFADAYELAFGEGKSPPTLLLPERAAFFFDDAGALSPAVASAVRRLFARFATAGAMDRAATEAWITAINGQPGRGSEWDKALEVFARRGEERLTEADMVALYEAELREGKPWGVLHDLLICEALDASPPAGVLAKRVDQIQFSGPLTLAAASEPLTDEQRRLVHEQGATLPNAWHPSDHLPLGAVFRWA